MNNETSLTINIRPARKEDANGMMCLIKELAEYEKAPEQVTVSIEHFVESGFGVRPVWWGLVAVAEEEGPEEIVGMALYYIRYSTWKGQRMYLEDIIVNHRWRGRGIGGMLMDELIQLAQEKKYNGITWQVLEWNQPAISFYEKYNAHFDKEWVNVSIDL